MASMLRTSRRLVYWGVGVGVAVPLMAPIVMAESRQPVARDKIKPSELPIYEEPKDLYNISYHVSEKGSLEEGVTVVREEVTKMVEATRDFREEVDRVYQTGKAHSASQINYILDEENVGARAAVIAAGGLFGLLLGRRKKGGFFKKLLYTTIGAGGTTAALYPNHTRIYSEELINNASIYTTVAYNFAVGK